MKTFHNNLKTHLGNSYESYLQWMLMPRSVREKRLLRRNIIEHIYMEEQRIANAFNNHKGQRTWEFELLCAYELDELRGGEQQGGRNWLRVFRELDNFC